MMHYVNILLAESVLLTDIGIICNTTAQVLKIKECLKLLASSLLLSSCILDLNSILVDTIDNFQRNTTVKVLILSTVVDDSLISSIPEQKLDTVLTCNTVSASKYFNLALSCAQCLVITVGNVNVLSRYDTWKHYVNYCAHFGSIVEGLPNVDYAHVSRGKSMNQYEITLPKSVAPVPSVDVSVSSAAATPSAAVKSPQPAPPPGLMNSTLFSGLSSSDLGIDNNQRSNDSQGLLNVSNAGNNGDTWNQLLFAGSSPHAPDGERDYFGSLNVSSPLFGSNSSPSKLDSKEVDFGLWNSFAGTVSSAAAEDNSSFDNENSLQHLSASLLQSSYASNQVGADNYSLSNANTLQSTANDNSALYGASTWSLFQ